MISPSYGLAETTLFVSGSTYRRPVVTTVSADRLKLHQFVPAAGVDLVSCGTPDDFDVLIADTTTGAELPPDGIGEIWLRGPSVSAGYWRNEPAAERAFGPDGYLRTGDLGALHDGELYVTGRLDEMVVVHGRNLYPQDIERELRARHAELAGAGAAFTVSTLTVSTAEAGTEDVLVVTHEVNGRLAEDRLRGLAVEIKQTVAREFGVPLGGVGLLRRGGVRRTTSGKIQRVVMRQLFLDGGLNTVYADYGPRVADALRLRRPAGHPVVPSLLPTPEPAPSIPRVPSIPRFSTTCTGRRADARGTGKPGAQRALPSSAGEGRARARPPRTPVRHPPVRSPGATAPHW